MREKIAAVLSQPFVRFALSGGLAAAANIFSRILISQVADYSTAIVIAYLIGMTMAYILMKLFVFDKSGRGISQEYIRFGLVNLIAIVQVWLVSMAFFKIIFPAIQFHFHTETISHAIGVFVPVFTSYLLHKYFTFSSGVSP
jgi:putative flippase GtrA